MRNKHGSVTIEGCLAFLPMILIIAGVLYILALPFDKEPMPDTLQVFDGVNRAEVVGRWSN